MRTRFVLTRFSATILLLLTASFVCAQSDRGTITGTITDQAGASVAGAAVDAKNTATGAVTSVVSTATGNYVISSLPVGAYEVTAAAAGFKKYVRSGITVQVAQTLSIDITLEVGAATESISVTADASQLKTESADISQNITARELTELPIHGVGSASAGSSGVRNPNNVVALVPGTFYQPNSNVKINGAPTNTQAFRVEGMDASNQSINFAPAQVQPSIDAIQEISVQTSNFAAEFGQVGGGFFNVTMRSGGNQFHGSGYDYVVNEVFNAATPFTGYPFTSDGPPNEHVRPRARRHDWGATIGGPVWIPKVYNGKDRTFFFFNWEKFQENQIINNAPLTVPTDAYRAGNFSAAIAAGGNRNLGTDALGRPIIANTIYNPATARTVGGITVYDPFPNNTINIPMDSVALKVQDLIPHANVPGALVNNYIPQYNSLRETIIPSIKVDHLFGPRHRVAYYYSRTHTDSPYSPTFGNSEGLPDPITATRGTFIHSYINRLNYDFTVTPTMLFHLGVGYQQNNFFDDAPVLDYNPSQKLGLKNGSLTRLFPRFEGFCPAGVGNQFLCPNAGGLNALGPAGQTHTFNEKPAANGSLSWVHGNHSYKTGFDMFELAQPTYPYTSTAGLYSFSANETALPTAVQGASQTFTGGTIGLAYASFLLGRVDSYSIAAPAAFRQYKAQVGAFVQDSWKVNSKLTFTYGLRYDYGQYLRESRGRALQFSPTTLNPSTGNAPGGFLYEANCNCNFASNYKLAFAPRLGVAYQINSKTVVRAGWGIIYGQTGIQGTGLATSGVAALSNAGSPGQGQSIITLANGIPNIPSWPNLTPGSLPILATGNQALPAGVGLLDQNAGRPPRQNQWSIGMEREFGAGLVVEAAYVGNRGVWWASPQMLDINAVTPQILASRGLSATDDVALLTSTLSSTLATSRGFNKVPYVGFSTANTVAQSLRPFPQFGIIPVNGAPLGKTWYDSLQVKANKRLSHGLSVGSAFTFQKSLQVGVDGNQNLAIGPNQFVNNAVTNPTGAKSYSRFDQPLTFVVQGTYQVPKWNNLKILGWLTREWSLSTLLQYSSGLPIPAPIATGNNTGNLLFQPTFANRVAGQPLYNVSDINCHCYDVSNTFVLNKDAWANPTPGQFASGSQYYGDYRYQRHPVEGIGAGRTFRFGSENRFGLTIRADFANIFNRTQLADSNLTVTGPQNSVVRITTGPLTGTTSSGFGTYSRLTSGTQFGQPRSGVVMARFTF